MDTTAVAGGSFQTVRAALVAAQREAMREWGSREGVGEVALCAERVGAVGEYSSDMGSDIGSDSTSDMGSGGSSGGSISDRVREGVDESEALPTHENSSSNSSGVVSGQPSSRTRRATASLPLLPSVEIDSESLTHENEEDSISTTHVHNVHTQASHAHTHSPLTGTVRIKTTVFEECKEMCNKMGIPNSDMVALNFLCERSLAPHYSDKSDDDQSKAVSAATRAMAVIGGEPYSPQDIDVINRVLKVSHCGDYITCQHPDFITTSTANHIEAMPTGSSNMHFNSEKPVIRVLWIKFPIYQSSYTPYRNEKIEFIVDSNVSKMVNDVDRTIRSLINVYSSCGLSKRNDKMNAYYLLTSRGDIMLLSSGLLKLCPKKEGSDPRSTLEEGSEGVWSEPLFLCLHDAVPGEPPKPSPLTSHEWKYVFPILELGKLSCLMIFALLVALWTGGENENEHSLLRKVMQCAPEFSAKGLVNLFFLTELKFNCSSLLLVNNSSVGIVTNAFNVLRSNGLLGQVSRVVNSFFHTLLSPLLSKMLPENISLDFTLPCYFATLGYGIMLVMRLRAKFCPFNLSWFVINRHWFACRNIAIRQWIIQYIRGGRIDIEENKNCFASINVRYEETNSTRFLVMGWVPTNNFDEDYDLWSATLRSALGVSTSSQNDPDMLASDPRVSGVRITLSSAFLKHQAYNDRPVFRICKPGMASKGYEGYFNDVPYIYLAALCWIWADFFVARFLATSITTNVVNFLWRNTLSSLMVNIADTDKKYWPSKAGHSYCTPVIVAVVVGSILW